MIVRRRASPMESPRSLPADTTNEPNGSHAVCTRLQVAPAEYASQVQQATTRKRAALQARIQTLHPGIYANLFPLLLLVTTWLLFSVAAPVALLMVARADGTSHDDARIMRIVAYCLFGVGGAWLLSALAPIVLFGLLCVPRPPKHDGPFLKESQVMLGETSGASSIVHGESKAVTLEPQLPVTHNLSGRCVYILVNSHGQHGPSAREKASLCEAHLRKIGCCVHSITTQYAGHLVDLGRDPNLLPLERALGFEHSSDEAHKAEGAASASSRAQGDVTSVAAVLIIGGDGSFSEFVNGYLVRCTTHSIAPSERTPIGLIPGGSGNSLARDLYQGELHVEKALGCVLEGKVKLLDVNRILDSSPSGALSLYSTNVLCFGLVGDTAVVAEDYRWLGDGRYDLCAVWSVLRRIRSEVRFVVKGLGGKCNRTCGAPLPATSSNDLEISGSKATVFFNLTQHFGKALRACPHAKLDDGLLDVVVCEAAERNQLLTMFKQLPGGSHLGNKAISHYQAQEAQVTPIHPRHEDGDHPQRDSVVVNVDGENVCLTGTVTIQAMTRQIPVFCP